MGFTPRLEGAGVCDAIFASQKLRQVSQNYLFGVFCMGFDLFCPVYNSSSLENFDKITNGSNLWSTSKLDHDGGFQPEYLTDCGARV